jgi:hypothetical protein
VRFAHMYVDDLRVELAHAAGPGLATVSTRVRHTPGFRVEGRGVGVFPAGMLDWFIPGDIPGLARRMSEEEQSADIRKLLVAYRDALSRDLERFARCGEVLVP